jgi:hypothetical protein
VTDLMVSPRQLVILWNPFGGIKTQRGFVGLQESALDLLGSTTERRISWRTSIPEM